MKTRGGKMRVFFITTATCLLFLQIAFAGQEYIALSVDDNTLHRINSNLETTRIGTIVTAYSNSDLYGVFERDGTSVYIIDRRYNELLAVSLTDCSVISVVPFDYDIAVGIRGFSHDSNGIFYGIFSPLQLRTVNTLTGETTFITNISGQERLENIAFSADDTLYAVGNAGTGRSNYLYSLDIGTGELTEIGFLGNGIDIDSMSFGLDGYLYGCDSTYGMPYLYKINPMNASLENMGLIDIVEVDGLLVIHESTTLLLSTPNGGEKYLANKIVKISYESSGEVPTVDIEYSTDNGLSWNPIEMGVPNTGTYEWTTPDIDSENYLVRISSTDNPSITDFSDTTFIVFHCSEKNPADINQDCYVNLEDLALLAQNWLWCGDRYNPNCGVK